jgi:hypothetical protein
MKETTDKLKEQVTKKIANYIREQIDYHENKEEYGRVYCVRNS